jgi:hypothetical protein
VRHTLFVYAPSRSPQLTTDPASDSLRQRIAARDAADRLTLNLMFAAAAAVAVVAAGAHVLKRRAAANAEPERMRKIAAKLRATQARVGSDARYIEYPQITNCISDATSITA